LFSEPKVRVLDYSSSVKLLEAVDERGKSLVPEETEDNPGQIDVFGNAREEGSSSRWEADAVLHHPKGSGSRIAKLRGEARLVVQTRSAAIELPLAGARNLTKTIGGLRMLVKSADASRVDLTVYRDGRSD